MSRAFVDRHGVEWDVTDTERRTKWSADQQPVAPFYHIVFTNDDETIEATLRKPLADASDQELQAALDQGSRP